MSAADYSIAAIPEPWQILGLRLKSFCIGHYLLMERFGCAFVSDEERVPTFSDLILGVLICSMSYEGFLEFIENSDRRAEAKAWGAKIGGSFDTAEKCRLFRRYINEGCRQPTVIYENEGKAVGGHWSQYVLGTLTGPVGYTLTEARNLPLPQAFADFYRHAESLGILSIASPEVEAAIKLAEADQSEISNLEFGYQQEAPIWP